MLLSLINAADIMLEKFKKFYGSDKFQWRITHEEFDTIYNVIIMRKFAPEKNVINLNILRIIQSHLLVLAEPINYYSLENPNPHL